MSRLWASISARPTAVSSMALALALSGTLGCGGTGERLKPGGAATADAGLTVDPCNLSATLNTHQFGCTPGPGVSCFDFEGYPVGSGSLPTGWFAYIDQIATNPEFIDPNDGTVITTDATPYNWYTKLAAENNHCGDSKVAYHMLAKNQNVWGPQFGAKFDGQGSDLPPVNVSDWEGMAFWIKKGTDQANDHMGPELEPTGTSLFVSLRDPNTTSNSSHKDSDPPCNDASNIDSNKCDPFGAGVGFDTTWHYVMIPFDAMKQRGYGVHEDELDRTQIESLYFSMDIGDAANGNWNVWIDDVVLYNYK